LGFTDNTIVAVATVGLSVPDFNQNVSTPYIAPPLPGGVGSVSYTGLLQTGDMTFLSCPCSTSFTLVGAAEASGGNGTYASFADPVSFILPPGWTYTLAFPPPQPAEVPEPSSGRLALIGLGLLAIGAVRRTAVRGMAPISIGCAETQNMNQELATGQTEPFVSGQKVEGGGA